jgi:hypothetical protein
MNLNEFILPLISSKMPSTLSKISCKCGSILLDQLIRIKKAPSDNWKDVIELW